jgi:hypothetical protein
VVAYKPMWPNMWASRTVTNNPCPHINAELLLVSIQYYLTYNSQIICFWTHVDMDNLLVVVQGTLAQIVSASFSYTPYTARMFPFEIPFIKLLYHDSHYTSHEENINVFGVPIEDHRPSQCSQQYVRPFAQKDPGSSDRRPRFYISVTFTVCSKMVSFGNLLLSSSKKYLPLENPKLNCSVHKSPSLNIS